MRSNRWAHARVQGHHCQLPSHFTSSVAIVMTALAVLQVVLKRKVEHLQSLQQRAKEQDDRSACVARTREERDEERLKKLQAFRAQKAALAATPATTPASVAVAGATGQVNPIGAASLPTPPAPAGASPAVPAGGAVVATKTAPRSAQPPPVPGARQPSPGTRTEVCTSRFS